MATVVQLYMDLDLK